MDHAATLATVAVCNRPVAPRSPFDARCAGSLVMCPRCDRPRSWRCQYTTVSGDTMTIHCCAID
jgi:hypothetical protein